MSTPIALKVRVVDLRQTQSNTTPFVLATSTNVLKSRVKNTLDAAGELEIGLPFEDAVTPYLIAACGGAGFNGTILPYGLEFSYDNGASWDSAMWVENHTLDMSMSDFGIDMTGNDISDGFNRIYIDRVTFVDVRCDDIMYGDFGTIGVGDNALIQGPPWFPWQRGLWRSVPGRSGLVGKTWLAFDGIMDSHLANLRVTFDAQQDSIMRCTSTLMKAIGGVYKPNNDNAPFGSRQHFTVDVKNRQILAGHVGTSPVMTFVMPPDGGTDGYTLDETLFGYITDSLTIEPTLEDMRAQVAFIGGDSNHGLPDGAKITGIVCINTQTPAGGSPTAPTYTTAWDASLLVVACSTGNEGGGLFYLVDKNFYPICQQLDINDLAVVNTQFNEIYAATNYGVIHGNVSSQQQTFPFVGGLTASIATVHWSGSHLTAVANGSQNGTGVNGIYVYPALADDADNSAPGYALWSRPSLTDVVDALYIDTPDPQFGGLGSLLYVDSSAPNLLVKHVIDGSQTSAKLQDLTYAVQGFDTNNYVSGPRAFIRTSGGSLGIYQTVLDSFQGAYTIPLGSAGLNDQFGALAVNKFLMYPTLWSINAVPVTFLASTDRGLYYCQDLSGGQWYPTSGQSGITDVTGEYVAAGTIQMVLGRILVRLFVASDNSLYVSNTGGIYFQDILSLPLDLAPAFYALAQQANALPFPDNDVGGIAINATTNDVGHGITSFPAGPSTPAVDNQDLENNGGSGTVIFIAESNQFAPALGLVFCRRMTERNEFTYRVLDVTCEAPYNSIEPSQLTEMAANDATDALTGSLELLVEHYRYLLICRQPKITVNLTSSFTTQEAALRTLRCGDMVAIDYTLGGTYTYVDLTQQNYYVWDKEMTTDDTGQGPVSVALTLVSVAGFAAIDLQQIVSAVANGFGRDRRFRSWHVR